MLVRLHQRGWAWDAVLLLVWAAVSFVVFTFRESQLFWNFDGSYFFDLLRRQHAWAVPLDSLSMDFFQGLGDAFLPANMRLLPESYLIDLIANRAVAKAAFYAVQLLELSVAVTIFGRLIGIGTVASLAGALLVSAAMFPFYQSGATHPIVALSPAFTPQLTTAYVFAICFLLLGRGSVMADIGLACAMVGIGYWVTQAGPLTIVLSVFFLAIVTLSGVIAAQGPERWRKIGAMAGVTAILAAGGAFTFLAGLILNSAPAVFTTELVNDRQTFFYTSMLFHWRQYGPVGPLLAAGGILGALISVRSERRIFRFFAITLLTYLVSRLVFGVLVIVFDFWRGPSPLYFEFFAIPLYCLFAAVFCTRLLQWTGLSRRLQAVRPALAKASIVLVLCVSIVSVLGSDQPQVAGFSDSPKPTAISRFLESEVGLVPGDTFRGRVATMTGRTHARRVGWLDLHREDIEVANSTGGDTRLFGLHRQGVPTLMQYAPTITPALYAFTTRLLAAPQDMQMRSALVLRLIDTRILALVGVRYVITDKMFDGNATLRLTMPVGTGRQLYLYELADPNLGTYSPTRIVGEADATATLTRILQPDFDGRREAVSGATLPGDLVGARTARLVFEGATLRVKAESNGRSLLVLPVEYSRCLQTQTLSGEPPVLLRVNLVQTGFVFRGSVDVRLRLRSGPMVDSSCRLLDRFDLDALKIGDVPRALLHR